MVEKHERIERYENIERFNPSILQGLSFDLVKLRMNQNLSNTDSSISSRSTLDILKANTFTLFNFINFVLATALIYTGSYKNLMFMGVVICNCVIGIMQEIRAKKAIEKLSLLHQAFAKVIRGSKETKIRPEEIVLDDILKYSPGSEIGTDSLVIQGTCEVNEALLTGETDLIFKKAGDTLFAGSYVINGTCYAKAERVGPENYISKIYQGAKNINPSKSEIMYFLKNLIKIISIFIVPIGVLLFFNQFKIFSYKLNPAINGTSSALIGMIPEGLVLLTSTALAVSVTKLAKYSVLVRDIYCIEALARTDTLCLDKTGTITEGNQEFKKLIPTGDFTYDDSKLAIEMLVNVLPDSNETFSALKNYFNNPDITFSAEKIIPFSSERKYSAAYFKDKGGFMLGAAEFVFKNLDESVKAIIDEYSKNYRVLVLAHCSNNFSSNCPSLSLMAFILLQDKIRKNAKKTFDFFQNQGLNIKVISGDSPVTVSSVSKEVGIANYQNYVDMSDLNDYEDIKEAAKKYTIFGRVSPTKKRDLIKALKENGHTVAMTGDGVNDILALKEANCSVSMASGSDACCAVSQIVLLNSDFSSMPQVFAQGQQTINNIQRVSSLFLTKTIYSFFLAILFLFFSAPYPFIPIQMTLISALTIGIPAFVLALEPSIEPVTENFVQSILKKSLPASLAIISNVILFMFLYKTSFLTHNEYSNLSIMVTASEELILLYLISMPLNTRRKILLCTILLLFIASFVFLRNIFSLAALNLLEILIFTAVTLFNRFSKSLFSRLILKFT